MPDEIPVSIGSLRWIVDLKTRLDVANPDTAGAIELYDTIATVHANIEPITPLEFKENIQIGMTTTHKIYMRWMDFKDLSKFHVIQRTLFQPDGSTRNELYMVQRVTEWNGRHRFMVVEAKLEKINDLVVPQPFDT